MKILDNVKLHNTSRRKICLRYKSLSIGELYLALFLQQVVSNQYRGCSKTLKQLNYY
jgi:hypothetical protein